MVSSLSFMQLKWKDKSFCLTLHFSVNKKWGLPAFVPSSYCNWSLESGTLLYWEQDHNNTLQRYQDKRGCILMKLFFSATSIRCFAISSWVTSRPVTRCFQVSDMNGLALCFLTLAALPCGKQLFIVHFKHKADELLKLSKRSAILRAAMVAHS